MANYSRGGDFPSLCYGAPIKVHWDGWESDTRTLGSRGWEFEAFQDVRAMLMVVAMKHRAYQTQAWCQTPYDYERAFYERAYVDGLHMRFELGREVRIERAMLPDNFKLTPIHTDMHMRPREMTSLSDLAHFKPKDAVMVEADPTVDDLLAQIIAKQADAKREYFEDKVRSGKLVQASSAEIIQFARAA